MADEQENTGDKMGASMERIFANIVKRESEAPAAASDASAERQESTPATAAPEATDTASGDRARGPDGKFIPKSAVEPTAPATSTPDLAEPTAVAAAPSTAQPANPPVSWSAEAKAAFVQLSPAVQQAVLKREKEVSDGFAQKSAELKEYEPLKSVIGPRQHALSAAYGSVANGIQTLFALSD